MLKTTTSTTTQRTTAENERINKQQRGGEIRHRVAAAGTRRHSPLRPGETGGAASGILSVGFNTDVELGEGSNKKLLSSQSVSQPPSNSPRGCGCCDSDLQSSSPAGHCADSAARSGGDAESLNSLGSPHAEPAANIRSRSASSSSCSPSSSSYRSDSGGLGKEMSSPSHCCLSACRRAGSARALACSLFPASHRAFLLLTRGYAQNELVE